MSDMTSGAATGGQIGPSDAAAGGTPDESNLPGIQGLGDSVDDPTDPEASQRDDDASMLDRFSAATESGAGKGSSDPMPDMSGTGGA